MVSNQSIATIGRSIVSVTDYRSINRSVDNECQSSDVNNNNDMKEQNELKRQLSSDQRRVPKTLEEYSVQQRLRVEQPSMPRLARVAIIGSPNAGKSTLTNQLVGRRVSSVSMKVHTTRHKVVGIIVEDDTQVEFLDTPGLVTHKHCVKHGLEPSFISDPLTGADAADLIAVITDVSNVRERERLNAGIIKLLDKHRTKESILILNKIDKIREKRKLLDITTRLTCGIVGGISSIINKKTQIADTKRGLEKLFQRTENKLRIDSEPQEKCDDEDGQERMGWHGFSHVFMTSALTGDGIEDVRQYLLTRARFKPWLYHRSQVTNQSPNHIVKTTLREKFLDFFREEIPYKIDFSITMWHLDEAGNLFISVDVICPLKFQSLVIGPKGQTIASIVQSSRESLTDTFHCDVSLKLIVKGVANK